MKKIKIKMKRLITDTVMLLGSVFVIGLIGFAAGMAYYDSIPIVDASKTCFSSSALLEHDKRFIKMAYEDCADDFSEELKLCSEAVNPFPNTTCPAVYDCPEIEECDDCSEAYDRGYINAIRSSKQYE